MARKSSIDRLDPAIRGAVLTALAEDATIDEVVDLVREMGGNVSRSAAGRYSKSFAELARQQRDLRSVAEGFGREFGEGNSEQRMMTQLMTSVISRALLPIASGDEIDLSSKELSELATAVQRMSSAAKVDVDREIKVREEAGRRAREQAANDADKAGRAAGADEATLRAVRVGILGLAK